MGDYIRTRLAVGWDKPEDRTPGLGDRVVDPVSRILPEGSNPNYGPVMHLIDAWLIEFPDEDPTLPWREIGVDANGEPVLAGPTEDDYGFWLDTNMERSDFSDAEEIPEALFESLWAHFFAQHPDLG